MANVTRPHMTVTYIQFTMDEHVPPVTVGLPVQANQFFLKYGRRVKRFGLMPHYTMCFPPSTAPPLSAAPSEASPTLARWYSGSCHGTALSRHGVPI